MRHRRARNAAGRLSRLVVIVGLVAGAIACGDAGGSERTTLRIGAAASLGTAMERLQAAYETEHADVAFTVTTDSSAAIRTQVEQGAAIDVFLSADTRNPQALADAGLSGDPVPFASNALALVVPADNPARIEGPADLARDGVRLIAAGEQVPIAGYADEVLERIAAAQPDPAGFLAAVRANIASREENVGAVLARIELGEGDAAFVYATDARANDDVVAVPIPDEANVLAIYAGVVPVASASPGAAAAFLAWVSGPEGTAILAGLGFRAP